MSSLRIGSLFSGIGGLELGLEHATGGHVAWQVERDPWCRQVLARHWPDAARFDDVCAVGEDLSPVDLVCGGFPCQPASLAGQRKGMDDERWLWGEFARILRVVRPRFVVLENVPGLLSVDRGRAWGAVLGDLAALGFAAEWDVFRASDVGAPHRRERVFLVGVADAERRGQPHAGVAREVDGARGGRSGARDQQAVPVEGGGELAHAPRIGEREPTDEAHAVAARRDARDEPRHGGELAHAHRGGQQGQRGRGLLDSKRETLGHHADGRGSEAGVGQADPCGARLQGQRRLHSEDAGGSGRQGRAVGARGGRLAQPRVGRGADGLPAGLDGRWPAPPGAPQHEWEPPRTSRECPQRAARLKALGNAVVPAVAALAWRVLSERLGIDALTRAA